MLRIWKLKRYHEPLRSDCELERGDGADLSGLQLMELREWYLNLLDRGDLSMVRVSNIAKEVSLKSQSDGSATVALPAECRRVIEVKVEGWNRSAEPVTPDSTTAQLQASEFSRGGCRAPVAVVHNGYLHLYTPPSASSRLETLKCVMEPSDGQYELDESALATIESE